MIELRRVTLGGLALVALVLTACAGNGRTSGRQTLSADEVRSFSGEFESLATSQIEAWNTHDVNRIRQVYTEDIVHHDGYPLFEGIDELESMASQMMTFYPNWEGRLGGAFINGRNGLHIWEIWNSLGFTEDHRAIEFDLLEARDGRISYWTLFYGPDLMQSLGQARSMDDEIVKDYAEVWSSGVPRQAASIYAQDAVREDALFGERHQGRQSIEDYATNFFSWYPDISLELVQSFSERPPGKVQGGVFKFHVLDLDGQQCAVSVAVLLEPSEEGMETERIYYDAESLIACGWAR